MSIEKSPLVTVYITSCNYGRFIEQAINSVLGQTLSDFELIIIDDGSTDYSREVIERYVGHPKIIPIFQHNKGLNVTNNIALRAARGRYITRLDADDWLDSHALEVMSNLLERNPQVGLVFPDYYLVDAHGTVLEQVRRHDFDDVNLLDQPAHGACTMIRRSCLLEIGGYDENFRCQDGYDLWIRFIEHFKVRNINLPLFYYRQHGTSLTKNEDLILSTRAEIIRRHAEHRGRPLKVLAVIPVRGSMTDPSSLVFREIGGRALLNWTVEAALSARRVHTVAVTTPDPDVLAHVRAHWPGKVLAIERDPRLAIANTYLIDTIRHALAAAEARDSGDGEAYEAVMQLTIESPFRAARHIDAAIEVMELFDTDTVVGTRPETGVLYRHNGSGLVPVRENIGLRLEREDIYREVGSMRLLKRSQVTHESAPSSPRVGHVVFDAKAAYVLRSEWDMELATYIADRVLAEPPV